jgi:predicted nucleotidyltransferase
MHLHDRLAAAVNEWRAGGYATEAYPTIAEILEWARGSDGVNVRFLRIPQLHALETYWYLRLVCNTPKVLDLYRRLFPRTSELLKAIGLGDARIIERAVDESLDGVLERVRADDDFVRNFRAEAVRETLTLSYPSYILALAMGAGKTVLIGAIIATEFAMALEHPDGPFVQNALVFAPGKTILESLRELLSMPYASVLPPRLHKGFAASVKMTFTRDGEKDVPVVRGSLFNVVVTNTEKIRIQKETIRKADIQGLLGERAADEARAEVANLRLQAIASLPHLAVFSDEAHHTYGQSLDAELKKVRKTVDYLAANTHVLCVINTTGTPYFQRQPLRDVVIWYGLSQGIREGILKDVAGNIQALHLDGDARQFVSHVIGDFFADYRDVRLPNGAPAKLAVYFPQTHDLVELRPVVDEALVRAGLSPALALVNTSDQSLTRQADIDAFNRLNDPDAPHRVVLLVNKGTEGWNCPSLFACALARKLKTSNNFVLQAATRCLRQVPGNTRKARIYLSHENYGILDRQLQETYGERIEDLDRAAQERRRTRLVLRKLDIPPLVVRKIVRTVIRQTTGSAGLRLTRPVGTARPAFKRILTLADDRSTSRVLQQLGDSVRIETVPATLDAYAVAAELAAEYRLDVLRVVAAIRETYGVDAIPEDDLADLAQQIERHTRHYETREERVDVALALVRREGFVRETGSDGVAVYTAQIAYPVDKQGLLLWWEDKRGENSKDLGFHYSPLDFDSTPEMSFFEQVLRELNIRPTEVEDVYFTGGITDPAKTDFFVEYKDDTGKWRRYTPDFVIRKKPPRGWPRGSGRVLIVEIKDERQRDHRLDGERGAKAMELRRWEELNPDRLRYQIIFTASDGVRSDQLKPVRQFAEEPERPSLPIPLDNERIAAFCRKWGIEELAVFGSVLTPRFRPDSDVDFLATFVPDARWSLFDETPMEEELAAIVGRRVDLVSRRAVERSHNWIRRTGILESARPVYVEG